MRQWFTLKRVLLFLLAWLFWVIGGLSGLLFFAASFLFVKFTLYLWNKIFWKVSRRLTLSYLLMATASFLMGIAILCVVIYAGVGLLIQYEVDSQIKIAYDDILYWHDHLRKFPNPQTLIGLTDRYPGINVTMISDEGTYTVGDPQQMGGRVETVVDLIDRRFYLVVNDPGAIRFEVPMSDIVREETTYLQGLTWDVWVGKQEGDGNITSQNRSGLLRPRLKKSDTWADHLIFRSLYLDITYSLADEAERRRGSEGIQPLKPVTRNKLKIDADPGASRPVLLLILRISARDLYQSITPQMPGSFNLILIVLGILSAFILFTGGVTILFAMMMVLKINKSIKKLSAGGAKFSRGDFSYRIPVKPRREELSMLSLQFNRMAESIENYISEEKVKSQMLKEIEIASSIQRSLLPEVLNLSPMESMVHFEPCERVGGDYYDAFSFQDHNLFVIGDASGHGVPAAILMSMVKSVTATLVDAGEEPGNILRKVHEFLSRTIHGEQYITLQMAALHGDRLHLYNAGHPPPILVNGDGPKRIDLPSMPVGLLSGPTESSLEVGLTPGDVLFFYTDGLYEAENPMEDHYELDRLVEVVGSSPRHPGLVINNVLTSLDLHRQGVPLADDLTMVALRVP